MKSGQVAEAAGVNVETLRYYERRGLLREPQRLPSGYRAYGADAVQVVRFVRRAQELGFTLAEVEALLQLADGGPESCEAAQALANERLAAPEGKIASLRAMRDSLQRLVATCARPRGERECPLIQSISESATRRVDTP